MRLALVTTPPSERSGVGDYTRRLLAPLKASCDVRVFVAPGLEGEPLAGLPTESALDLFPREHDQVLFQLGNERGHAFMLPLIRALGGAVALHDWVLFDLAVAARPELARGGARGHLAAWREGGLEQLAVYRASWRDRRRARIGPPDEPPAGDRAAGDELRGAVLVSGWHVPERADPERAGPQRADGDPARGPAACGARGAPGAGSAAGTGSAAGNGVDAGLAGGAAGRWTGDRAVLQLPGEGCRRLRLEVSAAPGRALRLGADGGALLEHRFDTGAGLLELPLGGRDRPSVVLETRGLRVTREQRARGDARRLGCFVRTLRWEDAAGWHAVDLEAPAARPLAQVELARDRFRLPLNRSVVRWADAFVVHSEHVRARVLAERNAPTPVAVVPHGTERHWRDGDRRVARAALGLPPDWREAFLVTSFGAVQAHKRVDVLLAGLALALERRPDLRLALVGRLEPVHCDVAAAVARHGLARHVLLTDWVDEPTGRDFLHAADLAVQLRGPSTGGTSGGVHQALSAGRAVVASDLDEQAELPDACVRKLAPGPGEPGRLADLLVALRDDPAGRASLEAAAREHVERVAGFERTAELYLEALERFPRPRGHKRRMFVQRVRRAVRERGREGERR